jgi:hypothetical protein
MYINLNKAKIKILQNLFEVDFSDFSDGDSLFENKSFKKSKLQLNKHISNYKNYKFTKPYEAKNMKDLNLNRDNFANSKNDIRYIFSDKNQINNYNNNHKEFKKEKKSENLNFMNESERKYINEIFQYKNNDTHNYINNNNKTSLNNIYKNQIIDTNEFRIKTPNLINSKNISISTSLDFDKNKIENSDKRFEMQKFSLMDNVFKKSPEGKTKKESHFVFNEVKHGVLHLINEEMQKNNNLQDITLESFNKINLKNMLAFLFSCKFSKMKNYVLYFSKAENLFDDFFYIRNFIMKMNEIEILKNIFLNENQKAIFHFLKFPRINNKKEI